MSEGNGRTHEPDFRELVAEMDGLEKLMEERDKRYDERFTARDKAVEAALSAIEKQTNATFTASQKAIEKAEAAQASYNSSHNDRMPRDEALNRFKTLEDKIGELRESRSTQSGGKNEARYVIERLTAITAVAVAIGALVYKCPA